MTHSTGQPECPHCSQKIVAFNLPESTGWDGEFQLACFNDECPYYVRGWQWMNDKYGVKASYRYRVDPATGKAAPLAVWSPDAIKDRILDADTAPTGEATDHPAHEPGQ